jgi:hypothetical protein
MNRETVKSVLKKLKISDSPLPSKGGRRPKTITERAGRYVERLIREDSFITYKMLEIYLMDSSLKVSRPTVIACVRDLGFGSYYAAHKPRLTDKHKERQLLWTQQHVNWTEEQWRRVAWSDESRYTVDGSDGRKCVLGKVGERYEKRHIVETQKYKGGGVMIWSCFWAGGFGPLVLVDGSIDQYKYIDALAQDFHPWYKKLVEDTNKSFIFQKDGASCHTGGRGRMILMVLSTGPPKVPILIPLSIFGGLSRNIGY